MVCMAEFTRRSALGLIGLGASGVALGQSIDLHLPGGGGVRPLTTAFPGKGAMILQRSRGPQLETPIDAFDGQALTPNDRFFVRWHYADIPTSVDVAASRDRFGR